MVVGAKTDVNFDRDTHWILVVHGVQLQSEVIHSAIRGIDPHTPTLADCVAVCSQGVAWLWKGQVTYIAAVCRDAILPELAAANIDVGDLPLGKVEVCTCSRACIVDDLVQRVACQVHPGSISAINRVRCRGRWWCDCHSTSPWTNCVLYFLVCHNQPRGLSSQVEDDSIGRHRLVKSEFVEPN